MDHHVKSVNTDSRSNKRLRFTSSKQRSKRASADVYRSYKRRVGVTNAASREERVHHTHREESTRAQKRQKLLVHESLATDSNDDNLQQRGVLTASIDAAEVSHSSLSGLTAQDATEATFSEELDLAYDRSPNEIFKNLYRELWPLSRSLPEVLHHASTIVNLLVEYMLSNASEPHVKSSPETITTSSSKKGGKRERFIVNHATTDVLHLLGVLAKDLRHEIHPFLHTQIIPRVVTDLLNQPSTNSSSTSENKPGEDEQDQRQSTSKQVMSIDISIIEAAFRCLSYVFRYDAERLLSEVAESSNNSKVEPCLETLRQYYGSTLAHRRDIVRRLAAETYAPLVRKLKHESARKRHLKRVIRAFMSTASNNNSTTASARKLQANAIDGISHLFFEVARGASGQLHSKGKVALRVLLGVLSSASEDDSKGGTDKICKQSADGLELVHSVASSFLSKVCRHLQREHFDDILGDLVSSTRQVLDANIRPPSYGPQEHIIRLLHEVAIFRDGFLLKESQGGSKIDSRRMFVNVTLQILEVMIPVFHELSSTLQSTILGILCTTWRAIPSDSQFVKKARPHIGTLVQCRSTSNAKQHPAITFARDLMPNLPQSVAMGVVGTAILSAAASCADDELELCLSMILAVVASSPPAAEESVEEGASAAILPEGTLFSFLGASQCEVSSETKQKLLTACLVDTSGIANASLAELSLLEVAARCVPFVALVAVPPEDEHETNRHKQSFDMVSKWLLKLFIALEQDLDGRVGDSLADRVIVASLALESLASLCMEVEQRSPGISGIRKALCRAQKPAERLLHSNSTSQWALKGCAAYVQALGPFRIVLNDREQVFEDLIPNLRSSSHFRRLYALQILSSLPKKPFVTDHADLDHSDDLDEELTEFAGNDAEPKKRVQGGLCDVVDTLLLIELSPIRFQQERQLLSLISRVEILGRSSRLPIVYAEASANHMLGLLYIKFAPVWTAAVAAYVSLANGQDFAAWAPLHDKLSTLMNSFPESVETEAGNNLKTMPIGARHHHELCTSWSQSNGQDATLFGLKTSRYMPTDDATVLQHTWSILEKATVLLTKHSKKIVPVFLAFMHSQFYVYYPHDPDSRELRLEEHVEDGKRFDRSQLKGYVVHQRLISILKVFASVKGPKQLYKHSQLLSIFTALLGQETQTAQLAFDCIKAYKQPFLISISGDLEALFAKGGLKEGLLKLTTALETTIVDTEQRKQLVPFVMRVLFGRLSVRSGGSRSSKDSPAARRAAVLSFISTLCKSDTELYPLIYFMIRNYVPAPYALIPVEQQNESDITKVLIRAKDLTAHDLDLMPSQVHVGFLHLLEPVVRQLGHRISAYVHNFTTVILCLSKSASIKAASPPGQDTIEENVPEEEEGEGGKSKGHGAIRTLCFRRLSDVFAQFAGVDFAVYAKDLWESIERSVLMLPETVVGCNKNPALLSLLQTMSSYDHLRPILAMHDEVVPCVIKCLANASSHAVSDSVLAILENLLTVDDSGSSSAQLVQPHVDLVLRQFMMRLGAKPSNGSEPKQAGGPPTKSKHSITWRRELRILCQITELVEQDPMEGKTNDVADKLCTLLLPYLEQGSGSSDFDQLNVLKILESLIPQVESEAALEHFEHLSRLLGPTKGKSGITAYSVRHGISLVLNCTPVDPVTSKVTGVLQSLCQPHAKRVDELDYDSVIPCLNALVDPESHLSWLSLANVCGPRLIAPLLYTCLHYLFNDDGVVARGAFKALKVLIGVAANQAGLKTVNKDVKCDNAYGDAWLDLLEKTLVPSVRNGMSTRTTTVRRFYILLIAEVANSCRSSSKPNLYGDLSSLIREDEPDLDFFLNITHVQLHRRTKAFQRLRKALSESEGSQNLVFSLQALSNVLLPLAMHPVYESKTKAEEPFAVEAIATVGAISRHLSWSKYSATLWTALTQFERHPEQERYLVGMICAMIDGFHFDITNTEGSSQTKDNAVWRALEKRFIPRLESLLVKEKVDHRSGTKHKTLRASLILALVKLFKKFSKEIFESRLPRLLTIICDGLKSHESDARDVARNTLAKAAVDVGVAYLLDILRELTIALNDGFRLYVRMATVHSILLELAEVYRPPTQCNEKKAMNLDFDKCVPAIMDIVQQDLFGAAQERKDAQGVKGRYVKEAAGSKSHNVVEITASMILFQPSVANGDNLNLSSIHSLVSPLVERLKLPKVEVPTIRRVKECLSRVVTGLGRNPSVSIKEVLPFVHATAAPFVGDTGFVKAPSHNTEESSDNEDEDEPMKAIQVSGAKKLNREQKSLSNESGTVAHWRGPALLKASKDSKDAASVRIKEAQDLRRVQDGASAPKLTGSARYTEAVGISRINDPSNISAVVFSLRLLHSTLKKQRVAASEEDLLPLVDPFVPLLTTCVCTCRETDVVLLALRCLGIFLVFNLPSKESCAAALGSKTLELLGSTGVGSNQDNEMSQACFKMLILLMNFDQSSVGKAITTSEMIQRGEEALSNGQGMPLDSEQMKVLVSFLQESISTESHNSAMSLIKAIMSRRFVSPEFYDLMDKTLELSVRSPKATVRQQCSGIVVNYLMNYPLGEERLEQHLKQIVMNVKYEYEDGRLSGIHLATTVVEKVPEPVLEKYVQLFFLPLTMQFINDDSDKCREGVAKCLSTLLRRLPMDHVQSLYDYALRWSHCQREVQRASLQLFGIFVEARTDFLKRGETASNLLERLKDVVIHNNDIEEATDEWEVLYFSFLCLEKLIQPFPKLLATQPDVWGVIVKCLAHSHPFIKLVTSRLVHQHLESLEWESFVSEGAQTFLTQRAGSMYEVARNLCFQLNAEEEHQSDEITTLCIKSLCWILQAMKKYPKLCYTNAHDDAEGGQNPVGWVMKRLSGIAKPKGPQRRQAVFKAFAAFATLCPDVVFPHLELMLEPLHRVDIETANDAENPSVLSKQHQKSLRKGTEPEAIPSEASLARDVLRLLEDQCDPPDVFLTTYAVVKTKAREKKESRKLMIQSEAIRDPQSAAKRRQQKNERGRQKKKRRVDQRRMQRGASSKQRA